MDGPIVGRVAVADIEHAGQAQLNAQCASERFAAWVARSSARVISAGGSLDGTGPIVDSDNPCRSSRFGVLPCYGPQASADGTEGEWVRRKGKSLIGASLNKILKKNWGIVSIVSTFF